jgi:hypothetical protein
VIVRVCCVDEGCRCRLLLTISVVRVKIDGGCSASAKVGVSGVRPVLVVLQLCDTRH